MGYFLTRRMRRAQLVEQSILRKEFDVKIKSTVNVKEKDGNPTSLQINPIISTFIEKGTNIDVQIYNDINSVQELLLREAEYILSNVVDVSQEKYVLLRGMNGLGFTNAEEVKSFTDYEAKIAKQTEVKGLIDYYKRVYPFNKFIDEKSVNVICKKYSLVLSTVENYIAEVPLKNQKEIVSFRVKEKDIRFPHEILGRRRFRLKLRIENMHDELKEMVCGNNLLIIAPKHKFKTNGFVQDGNYLKLKDPIVLQSVNCGYIIVSQWGLEAGDELVLNSINN